MSPSHPLPTSMVAWQHWPSLLSAGPLPSTLRLNQVAAVPALKANQTLIKVLSAGLNPVDYKMAQIPIVTRLYVGSPSTPGIDYVGRVWATKLPESAGIKAGDLVYGSTGGPVPNGSLAAFTVVTGAALVNKVPEGVELDWLAGTTVAGITAYQSMVPHIEDQGPGSAKGKSVFINGASGGVGTFAVQIAKALGCENIVASCSSANADFVKELGATEVIDYRSVNVVDALNAWVKNKNSGRPFDVFMDNVGADFDLYYHCHEYVKEGGSYVFIGAGVNFKTASDLLKVSLTPAVLGGGKRPFVKYFLLAPKKEEYERLGKWMQDGSLKVMIDSTWSMDQVKEAFERMKTGRARGKIIVRVSEDGRGPGY